MTEGISSHLQASVLQVEVMGSVMDVCTGFALVNWVGLVVVLRVWVHAEVGNLKEVGDKVEREQKPSVN